MISRRTTQAIAAMYTKKFTSPGYPSYEKVFSDALYDFLYENEFEAWFCNSAKRPRNIRELKDWVLRLHTGETLYSVTKNWNWDQRRKLGQRYLKELAEAFILYYKNHSTEPWVRSSYTEVCKEAQRRLEIDGYVFRNGQLLQPDIEILDVEAERGVLNELYTSLKLNDASAIFKFLDLSEEHYLAERWSDCIGNARKFFESVLREVTVRFTEASGNCISAKDLERPVSVRSFLEREGLIEQKEREAIDKVYGLLSHTGAHPYMAAKDQARLLRQISLTFAQFILLRLEGALQVAT